MYILIYNMNNKNKLFFCDKCNINCPTQNQLEIHNTSATHIEMMISCETNTQPKQKIPRIFSCKLCEYNTSNKKDFKKHELTLKHQNNITPITKNTIKYENIFKCHCGKIYKHSSPLSTHKKSCVAKVSNENSIDFLLMEHKEFKNIIWIWQKAIMIYINKC